MNAFDIIFTEIFNCHLIKLQKNLLKKRYAEKNTIFTLPKKSESRLVLQYILKESVFLICVYGFIKKRIFINESDYSRGWRRRQIKAAHLYSA